MYRTQLASRGWCLPKQNNSISAITRAPCKNEGGGRDRGHNMQYFAKPYEHQAHALVKIKGGPVL